MKLVQKIIFCILFFTQLAFSQRGVTSELARQIENEIHSRIGDNYELDDVMSVDQEKLSRLRISGTLKIDRSDPTLKGAYIFTALGKMIDGYIAHKGFVGVYKNNQIIWHSDTVIYNDFTIRNTFVDGLMDLNNDGKLEIITLWTSPQCDRAEYLWIFSWDGNSGTLMNDVDEEGQSVIVSISQYFLINDLNGDGIWEINGRWSKDINVENVDSKVVYSWNGQKYGQWNNAPQPPASGFLPRNKVTATISAKVERTENNNFIFRYKVENSKNSLQEIDEFRIKNSIKKVLDQGGKNKWDNWFSDYNLIGWGQTAVVNNIGKGEIDSSFYFITAGLPVIKNYYLRGYNEREYDSIVIDWGKYYEDFYRNSVIGLTLGPADPPNPFIPLNFLDTLTSHSTQSRSLGWINNQTTADKYLGYFNSAKTSLQQNNIASTRTTLYQVLQDATIDSIANITSEAYALIRFNTEYLLALLPTAPVTGCNVKLVNSAGTKLTGGTLQYYDGAWKDAVNNNDGTFFVNTTPEGAGKTSLSLRMTYENGTQTKSNVPIGSDTIAFQTVNAQIQLQNSNGVLIDTGSVQYYAGAWRTFGTTINGIASKELLPANYSFRMTYAYASKDKQQDIGANPIVVFQTVNAAVQLQNSQGTLMPAPSGDRGTVQYYSGAWRNFGTTSSGVSNKELLPNNYSFRMTYEYASKDKQQDLSVNPTVVFQTVNAAVQLQNSQGTLMPAPSGDQGTVQYYSGAWRAFGTTNNGTTNKELLPNNYSFRMTYEYASKDKQQDISTNPTVIFQTVNAAVQLQNSQGTLIDQGKVQYYSGAWRTFGTTNNGTTNKELLPNNYSFRMTYEYASKDKQQDLSANPTVIFQTVIAQVQLKNSQGNLIPAPSGDQGTVQYYSGAWRTFGTTTNGIATKDLLPNTYSFRMTYEYASKDKQQDLSINPTVIFQTVNAQVQLKNSQGNLIPAPSGDQGTVQYYSGAWRSLGTTTNGTASKELLPNNYSFRMTYEYASMDKQQDITTNSIVSFATVLCTIRAKNSQNELIDGATVSYYSGAWRLIGLTINGEITKELLPLNLLFRAKYGTKQTDKQQNLSTNNIVEIGIQ